MQNKSKVPQIRFKGFSGEWQLNIEKIKIVSGNTYPLNVYNKTGVLLIQGLNIYPNKLLLKNPVYISKNHLSDSDIFIKNNDILIGLNRPIINNLLKACLFTKEIAVLYQKSRYFKL